MQRPDLWENWKSLQELLSSLGEQVFGRKDLPELGARLAELESAMSRQAQAAEALRKERDFLSGLIQSSPAFLVTLSAEGKTRMMNEAMLQALGYTLAEVLEKDYISTFIPEEDRKGLLESFSRVRERKDPVRTESRLLTRDGGTLLVEWNGRAVFREEGKFDFYLGVGQDITERRKAEEALVESWERHLSTLDAIPDLVYELAMDGTITYVNRTAAGTLGVSPEQVGLVPFSSFLEEHEKKRFLQDLEKLGSGQAPAKNMFYDLKTEKGRTLPVEVHATLPKRRGQPPTVLCVARDISYRRQLEERFRQSQRMEAVGRLAGGIAHDFNNLMTAITGYADLMLLTLRQDDPLRQRVEDIHKATESANSLTRQLMAFTRKQLHLPRVLNLNELVTDLQGMLRRFLGEDVELAAELDPAAGLIRADRAQIEQAILNLALNSRDAMPQGGRILIETRNVDLDELYAADHAPVQPGPYVMLAVTDTGVGMDEETRSHVFEPFFTTKEKGMGTGLGLSTVYGTVKQNGGFIWAYSEPDRGAAFKIYLPRLPEEEAPQVQPKPPMPGRLEGTETVLLVEDQDSLREMAREVLKRKGYQVLEARNAGEALLICEQHTGLVHLMLSDVVMPRMGGRDLYERLRPWHPEMKVLYMSGYTDDAAIQQGLLDPDSEFLEKPFSPDLLACKLRQVLDAGKTPAG